MYAIDDFSRLEALMKVQTEVLQILAQGKSVTVVLNKLTDWIEENYTGLIASVLCTDAEGLHVYHRGGNSLPKDYIEGINGFSIEADLKTSGSFAGTENRFGDEGLKESVIRQSYQEVALKYNLHSCWSLPLINNSGRLRGMFTLYYKPQGKMVNQNPQIFTLVAQTALLAIEYKAIEEERTRNDEHEKWVAEIIKKSEQRFQNLVREAPVGIVVLRGKEMIVDVVNEKYGKLIDRTPEQLLNKPLFDIIPDAEKPFRAILDEVRITGKPLFLYDHPYYVIVEGKEIKGYLNIVYQPYKEFDGTITGVMALCHDVTDQVKARRNVEKSEQKTRSIIESAPFPIGVYVGREMRIEFANQSIMDVWGKGNDVIGKCYAEVLPELANQRIYEQLDTVFTTGIPFHAKNQRVDLVVTGILQPFYFNYSFTPLYDTEGTIYGVMNTAAEVTELAVAYNKLEESEERARLAIEASELGTFHVNLQTNELIASPRMAEIFGVEQPADRNQFISAIHPADRAMWEKAYEKAYRTSILEYDGRLIKKDGFVIWIRVKGKIYFNETHEPVRVVGIVQDITEQKKFSETLVRKVEERTAALEEANRQLIEINDELQQFAYVSSHDLQEPLRKIRIFSDILSKQTDQEGVSGKYLHKISSSAERMTGLIQSLLEYSKVGNAQIRFEKVDMNSLLKIILTDYELLISQKNAIINIDHLPEIEAVPFQMNQLFFNLIGNALKFTLRSVQPVVNIKAAAVSQEKKQEFPELSKEKNYVIITIQDNGIGFDQDFATKIFTVFQRLNDRSNFGGYGIGLALCKKVVQAHKGLIFAEGKLKQGATFTIILPLQQ